MKCVITGSNGFIGSMLRDRLLQAGAEVRCLVRSGKNGIEDSGAKRFSINYENAHYF